MFLGRVCLRRSRDISRLIFEDVHARLQDTALASGLTVRCFDTNTRTTGFGDTIDAWPRGLEELRILYPVAFLPTNIRVLETTMQVLNNAQNVTPLELEGFFLNKHVLTPQSQPLPRLIDYRRLTALGFTIALVNVDIGTLQRIFQADHLGNIQQLKVCISDIYCFDPLLLPCLEMLATFFPNITELYLVCTVQGFDHGITVDMFHALKKFRVKITQESSRFPMTSVASHYDFINCKNQHCATARSYGVPQLLNTLSIVASNADVVDIESIADQGTAPKRIFLDAQNAKMFALRSSSTVAGFTCKCPKANFSLIEGVFNIEYGKG